MVAKVRSNADFTWSISKSIFLTNFPDDTTSKVLWSVCQTYGTVVDVFIPNRKSKASKRFAFIRFIRVDNVDRLVGNLCTLWIGHMHLHANVARFERTTNPPPRTVRPSQSDCPGVFTFASALQGNAHPRPYISPSPAMVLDDSCVVERDLENFVMGELKLLSSIPKLRSLLLKEGFQNVNLSYLGGLWVMIELESNKTKEKFLQHVGVLSWFHRVCNAQPDFVANERKVMELEECKDDLFARKRICIKTKLEDNILEKFKIIIRGKIFVIRAKELFAWSSVFKDVEEVVYCSDDESFNGGEASKGENNNNMNTVNESDDDAVSDTCFREHDSNLKEYSLPPGFTPENSKDAANEQESIEKEAAKSHNRSVCSRIVEDAHEFNADLGSDVLGSAHVQKKGGFVLELLDDIIKVRQAMGYSMEGCEKDIEGSKAKKDWIRELIIKHRMDFLSLQETKMDNISDIEVKLLWGNYCFDYVFSEALGYSGGLLCVWDSSGFLIENHSISDSFVVLYGLIDVRLEGHLSDHWPILLRDVFIDYGATPFRFNDMVRFKKKLQLLKKEIQMWVLDQKHQNSGRVNDIKTKLNEIDIKLGQGRVNDEILHSRLNLMKQLHDHKALDACECMQKAKIRGVMVDGEWVVDLNRVMELERQVSNDEIRQAVWDCGEDKSPGPDGFTFDFFRKYWDLIGPDFCVAVGWFFNHGSFFRGCNSLFVSLIPKVLDPKQILDGPFIINELLAWCKHHKHQAMMFKVDFAKAYDSIRWDYLFDVLRSFGFGDKWCSWIKGSLSSSMASILVNGSLTPVFQFHRGLKQGDPLAPYLFILVMKSLHLSFSIVVKTCIFKGIKIDNAVTIFHLFYADDAVFIGEWSDDNLNRIMHVLYCFSLASGLKINVKKSHLLGVGISHAITSATAMKLGCSVMKTPFKYLGVMLGGNMSRINAWDEIICKMKSRLSKWKLKTLSIKGRLTLLKLVLGSSPIYSMSLYKVPKTVLYVMELIRRNFFNGIQELNKDICVADKLQLSVESSFRCPVRGGIESHQLEKLLELLGLVIMSNSCDRWYWDLNGNGVFCVKDVRRLLDDFFLPKADVATRWIKQIPIKINIFAWRVFLDRLPSKMNLLRRGIQFVDGGIWFGCLLALIWIGFHALNLFGWVLRSNSCSKVFCMFHGGVFGISEIKRFLRLQSLGKQ
nr:RNA-directed DNA polymerase, eukaryota [Tanacetum cinerariifolium]